MSLNMTVLIVCSVPVSDCLFSLYIVLISFYLWVTSHAEIKQYKLGNLQSKKLGRSDNPVCLRMSRELFTLHNMRNLTGECSIGNHVAKLILSDYCCRSERTSAYSSSLDIQGIIVCQFY